MWLVAFKMDFMLTWIVPTLCDREIRKIEIEIEAVFQRFSKMACCQ